MTTETYATLETQLRHRLDEVSARQWSSAQLIGWIYDGVKEVAKKTEALRTSATITAVVGTQQYTMATDIVRVHRVTYAATGDSQIYPMEYRDFDSMDSVWWTSMTVARNTPVLYTMWGYPPALRMIVYPTPSVAGTFTVYYYKLPTNPLGVSSVTSDLPDGWNDVALDYATYMALLRDRDDQWQVYKALFDEHVLELEEMALRYSDQAGMIVPDVGLMVPRHIWDENY